MYELLTSPNTFPFAIALAVVTGLFLLELLSAVLGGSILGVGTDAPDVDADFDFDLSTEIDADIDIDVDVVDGPEGAEAAEAATSGGVFTWIGARDVPFLIWLVSFLTMFGLFGLILQSMLTSIIGLQLPALLASAAVVIPALAVTRIIANWVALLMPKTETTALKARHLGGYNGTITQGTASRGKPAEIKIKDRHGNIHYLRVEPLRDDEVFPQGSEVTLIRKRGDKFFVI
ncbi:YqiJ family protein [uncultured Aliiroseovarius sp.]|uniref:YqiJ family protein n=1 Tax=uncultured Aliiroseovarius sp. TaxID=1658783 RepID=UPI0026045078|nr:YqiJ family protein [uncultured Aliiroseovarius sp.]